jgi:hypothetical protein
MKRLLPILSGGYVVYALFILVFVSRTILRAFPAEPAQPIPVLSLVPVILFGVIGVGFITLFCLLAYFLATRRHHKAAIVLAAISCIGIPFGTILGVLSLITLTRPDARAEFLSKRLSS